MLRLVLLLICGGAGVASLALAHLDPIPSPISLPTLLIGTTAILLSWAAQRRAGGNLAPVGALIMGVAAGGSGTWLGAHGVLSLALALQAVAFVALAGFTWVDRPEPPKWLAGWWSGLAAVVVLGGLLGGLLVLSNPISTNVPEGSQELERVGLGEVEVAVYDGAVSAESPQGSWSYAHRGSGFRRWPNQSPIQSALVSSPDGAHFAAAFLVALPKERASEESRYLQQHIVVFETRTGRVVKEAWLREFVNVQLTNSAVLIGGEAYALDDGKLLWRDDSVLPSVPSLTATPERFIVGYRCDDGVDDLLGCELRLKSAQTGEESQATALPAMFDEDRDNPWDLLVVDGWVLDRAVAAVPRAEGAPVGAALVARNLDTGEEVPVGVGSGLNGSAGRLDIMPEQAERPVEVVAGVGWFDPQTKEVHQ